MPVRVLFYSPFPRAVPCLVESSSGDRALLADAQHPGNHHSTFHAGDAG
jgi:hypothetical protein